MSELNSPSARPVSLLNLPLSVDQLRALFTAICAALANGSDCNEETSLLEELADALSPGEACTLNVNELIEDRMDDRHPVERETEYWCQATDRARRGCTSVLGT